MMENKIKTAIIQPDQENKQVDNISNALSNPYIHRATSDNTRKAYRNDIRHYESWGGKLPATIDMIARYLEAHAFSLNPRTLARRLVAIRHWHTYQAFADPTTHPAIQKTMTGILRTHGKPKNKARAITLDEIARIHLLLSKDNSLTAARDNALLQIGFFGALRRSELVAIQYEQIKWDKNGIEIILPGSKTDQIHEGQYCAIPYGNHTLCPIRTLKNWLEKSSITNGPIFRRIITKDQLGRAALTPLSVNLILKNRAIAAEIGDIEHLSSHSLRRGLATSAAEAGAPLHAIMRAGRWKQTNTVMEYIEASDRFKENAAHSVLQSFTEKT